MQVYRDKYKNIYTDLDYCKDGLDLEKVILQHEKENFHVDHEDFVASVPGTMTLKELDDNLCEFKMCSMIQAPRNYSISKIISENHDPTLVKRILGLSMIHADESQTQAGSKVIKDVSGYDMKKLYIGSFNSLAIIGNAYINLEKRFDNQLNVEFKMPKNFNHLLELRDFIQSFLDQRIVFKVTYNKDLDDFSVLISTNSSERILDYRKKLITQFIKTKIKISSLPKICKIPYDSFYKDPTRVELSLEFSNLERLTELLKKGYTYDPLLETLTLKAADDLEKVFDLVSNIQIFPVTLASRNFIKSFDNDEAELINKIKKVYDYKSQLNPGVF